jgi:hypothetical protein
VRERERETQVRWREGHCEPAWLRDRDTERQTHRGKVQGWFQRDV